MPRVNPNADENDPLWPKAFSWPGGRALAPLRPPPLPSLPPEPKPTELEPYIVNPDIDSTKPKQGNPGTGQPVGPMFTKMPRDAQRQAVNKTFDQMVADAKSLKGSVFATPFDKALQYGSSDTMGGLSPQASGAVGVVANEAHPLFRQLASRFPKFANALRRMPQTTTYTTQGDNPISKNLGATLTAPSSMRKEMAKVWAEGGNVDTGNLAKQSEIKALLSQPKGSSVQAFPKGAVDDETLLHEGYHALYAPKNEMLHQPKLMPKRAHQLMYRVARQLPENDARNLMAQYEMDPAHGLIEALSLYHAKKGGMAVR